MENKSYKIVYEGGSAQIEEKKSRFIAHISPVKSEEEAAAFISGIKKEYWDARHNCSAFVIGKNNEVTRCSDDGEPAQTAGRPMLDVLLNENIHDCAAVVTRYFGGVLLGTGGLVRAYQRALQEGLKNCRLMSPKEGRVFDIACDYNSYGKIEYILREKNLPLLDSSFSENVNVRTAVPLAETAGLQKLIDDATSAKASVIQGDVIMYDVLEGRLVEV